VHFVRPLVCPSRPSGTLKQNATENTNFAHTRPMQSLTLF